MKHSDHLEAASPDNTLVLGGSQLQTMNGDDGNGDVPWYWSNAALPKLNVDAPRNMVSVPGDQPLDQLDPAMLADLLSAEHEARERAEARAEVAEETKQAIEGDLLRMEMHTSELKQQIKRMELDKQQLVSEKMALQESLMESDTEKMALERALLACSEQLAALLAEQNKASARKANTDKDSNAADQASSVGDDAAPGSPSNASSAAGDAEGPTFEPSASATESSIAEAAGTDATADSPEPAARAAEAAAAAREMEVLTEHLVQTKLQLAEAQAREMEMSKDQSLLQQLNDDLMQRLQQLQEVIAELRCKDDGAAAAAGAAGEQDDAGMADQGKVEGDAEANSSRFRFSWRRRQ